MVNIPERIRLANLPTKIEKLERLSQKLGGPCIYVKRDDQTGSEFSGNKIRKLEFSLFEALQEGCDYLITCGGIQSNHCRATAAVAAKLGMKSCLVLRGNDVTEADGNLLLDKLFGAGISIISDSDYDTGLIKIVDKIKSEAEKQGFKPYFIPSGASNGIGAFGYYKALEEIIRQEKESGVYFDAIVISSGSGGTYSGLFTAKKLLKHPAELYGFCAGGDKESMKLRINEIVRESMDYLNFTFPFSTDEINIIDAYVGRGYALSRPEELAFINELAKLEGIVLDPVYTGKAMYGLTEEIKKGHFRHCQNILFIHTGGLFGLFSRTNSFDGIFI